MTLALLSIVLLAAEIALPGGPPVGMDFIAYDASTGRLWVPAGNTGNVDVIDTKTHKITTIEGFATAPAVRRDRPNMGPSSVAIGAGVVWIGNRGDNQVCSFDGKSLVKKFCVRLPSMPDALTYVARTHEVWVTTPRDHSLTILAVDGIEPRIAMTMKLDGSPECYAVDDRRGILYTNLEDKDLTLALDINKRTILNTWPTTCGGEGPRGLAIDVKQRRLFVACTDGAVTLDLEHNGKAIGRIKTGGGVDTIEYEPRGARLFIASPKDGTLTIARVAKNGALAPERVVPTSKGARNPAIDGRGAVYISDSPRGRILVITSDSSP